MCDKVQPQPSRGWNVVLSVTSQPASSHQALAVDGARHVDHEKGGQEDVVDHLGERRHHGLWPRAVENLGPVKVEV